MCTFKIWSSPFADLSTESMVMRSWSMDAPSTTKPSVRADTLKALAPGRVSRLVRNWVRVATRTSCWPPFVLPIRDSVQLARVKFTYPQPGMTQNDSNQPIMNQSYKKKVFTILFCFF